MVKGKISLKSAKCVKTLTGSRQLIAGHFLRSLFMSVAICKFLSSVFPLKTSTRSLVDMSESQLSKNKVLTIEVMGKVLRHVVFKRKTHTRRKYKHMNPSRLLDVILCQETKFIESFYI